MIQFKWPILFAAIDAAVLVLEEQIGSRFPSCQRSCLIFFPADIGVLEQQGIEAHLLDFKTLQGKPAGEAFAPGEEIAHS